MKVGESRQKWMKIDGSGRKLIWMIVDESARPKFRQDNEYGN